MTSNLIVKLKYILGHDNNVDDNDNENEEDEKHDDYEKMTMQITIEITLNNETEDFLHEFN